MLHDAPLPAAFYNRDALDVAAALLGAHVVSNGVTLRITEVEAYRFPGDTANHARMGRTTRNAPMWGPPGHAYVYLCYGLHRMLNFVTGPEGHPAAVLIRGGECVEGSDMYQKYRPDGRSDGPGKLGAALGLDVSATGSPLFGGGPVTVYVGNRPDTLIHGPRVGIDYAEEEHRLAAWRLADPRSKQVGHRRGLSEQHVAEPHLHPEPGR